MCIKTVVLETKDRTGYLTATKNKNQTIVTIIDKEGGCVISGVIHTNKILPILAKTARCARIEEFYNNQKGD